MKKLWTKISVWILATIMMLSFSACGGSTQPVEDKSADTAAISSSSDTSTDDSFAKFKGTKLTYWHPFSSTYIKSIDENAVMQEMEKKSGIKIEFITPAAGQENEAFNLMIASGDYPDLINDRGYKGGGLKAIQDGVYLKLNDYIDQYAPNYKAVMALKPDIAKQAKEDDSTIWSFKCIQADDEPSWAGPAIRKDYLDELGLQMPKTVDDWYNVLKAFKEKKNIETPMLLPLNNLYASEAFASIYDSTTCQFLNKNGTVVYGPIEPGFKDYLTLMNKWYSEGLIDKDFATRDDKSKDAQLTSGKAGASATIFYGSFGPYSVAGKATDPKYNLVPTDYPVLNAGDNPAEVLHIGNKNWNSKGCDLVISTNCKNIEAAVKWIDYRYSDEGFMLFNYGIEGQSYKWVDGAAEAKDGPGFFPQSMTEKLKTKHPEFTELLTKNPDGVDFWTAIDKYKTLYVAGLRNPLSYQTSPEILEAMAKWSIPGKDYILPPLSSTDEESKIIGDISNQISTYREEMVYKFIMGVEPISNFDKYVSEIKKLGIDKVTKVIQDQLDRYSKR